MIFQWRWLLILFALVLGGGQIFAASPTKEQRAYDLAASAFQDGMWSRAETELAQFVQKYPKSTNAPQAVLLQAQAEFRQGELTNAIALLADTNNLAKAGALADEYVYWTGEAQFQNTNYPGAAEMFVSLAKTFPESPLRLRAVVEAASAYVRLGDWTQTIQLLEETNGVFQRAAQMDSANELVSRGRLLLAQAEFAQKDFDGEFAVLNSLNSQTLKPELDWQRAHLLYQNRLAAGEFDAALAATTNLFQIARLENDNGLFADSMAMNAEALEKLGRAVEAMSAYQENITNTAPAARQRQAVLKFAELAIAQKQFPAATNALETFLAEFPDSPAADVVVLTLGELHLKNYAAQPESAPNDLPEARARFDQFIGAFTNNPLAGRAHLDRGWCGWLAAQYPESFDDFKAAAQSATLPPEDLAVARFKMGDAQFAQKDFAGALADYGLVLDGFANFPAVAHTLGDRALYQSLRAEMELNDWGGASNTLARILKNYPASDLADSSALLYGEGLADSQQPSVARGLFQKSVEQFANSPLLPQIELAIARTYEQEQDWPSAIGKYEGWLKDFPANDLAPQASYSLAQANFQAGDGTNAFVLFTNFVAQFPTNELAPLAQWWVADSFYNAGDFVDAEKNYKYIFQNTNWQGSPLVNRTKLFYPAQMMAGRAAVARQGYAEAMRDYFSKLEQDTNCPIDLRVQATFAHGDALMRSDSPDTNNQLANFALATNEFSQIVQLYPTNEQGALAWLYIGDCNVQLNNYSAATNAYAQVFETNTPAGISAGVAARSQAKIAFGIALEKMASLTDVTNQAALFQLALQNYSDVFYENEGNLREGSPASSFWMKKAGLQAVDLFETVGERSLALPDLTITTVTNLCQRLEERLPEAKDLVEKKKAAVLAHLSPQKN